MAKTETGRPDTQEMVVVHRVFRREFALAPRLVAAVPPGDVARAARVSAHLAEMGTMLHHHHTSEDELIWPRLRERAELSVELVGRMEEQHARVSALLHRVDALRPQWAASAGQDLRDELSAVLEDVSDALDEHLAEEELEVLPLCAAHLTAREWAELGERGRASTPLSRVLVVFGHVLEEASPQERRTLLGHLPPPLRLLYRLVGQRRFEREVAELRRDVVVPRQRQG